MSYTHAEIVGGAVKGFTLVWPPAQNARMERVLAAMKQSFRALNGNALDATAVPISAAERQGLLAGLELKKPAQAASGFYVDARAQMLTSRRAGRAMQADDDRQWPCGQRRDVRSGIGNRAFFAGKSGDAGGLCPVRQRAARARI